MAKLTPGERMHNWATAFMTLWPAWVFVLGTLGYTNKDEIEGFIFTNNDTAISKLTPFEAYMRDEIERIDLEEATGRAKITERLNTLDAALKKQDRINYQALAQKTDSMQEQLTRITELVD